jgi:AcrR family transcriptional regulator
VVEIYRLSYREYDEHTQSMMSTPSLSPLVHHARQFFADRGYADVSVNEGAVYYQFEDKKDLFRAACTLVLDQMVNRVTTETMGHVDHVVDEIVTGGDLLFALFEAPDARQLLLVDGPSVLGMAEWTALHEPLRIELGEHALNHLADAGFIDHATVPMLSHLLFGAFMQGVLQIVASDDPAQASAEARAAYRTMAMALLRSPHAGTLK